MRIYKSDILLRQSEKFDAQLEYELQDAATVILQLLEDIEDTLDEDSG
jgi:hypothetical protein